MQWWCAALGEKWTWAWRAYPGVWLFVALIVVARRWVTGPGTWKSAPSGERGYFIAGVVSLWLSLDYPLGPIAAGYLASAHALQFLIITMISTPLLLLGSRTGFDARVAAMSEGSRDRLQVPFHPIVAAIIFNAVVAASHVPTLVDSLMPKVWGAFLVDFAWFAGGIVFWWPVIMSWPKRAHFGVPMKILYLLVGTLFHTVIGMILLVAEHPMYGIYELAQPIMAVPPRADQQLAGGIMELGVFFAIVIACGVLFFKWAAESDGPRATGNASRAPAVK